MDVKKEWRVRDGKKILADTVRDYPQLAETYKDTPHFLIGYLMATIQFSLTELNDFAVANPEFTDWR